MKNWIKVISILVLVILLGFEISYAQMGMMSPGMMMGTGTGTMGAYGMMGYGMMGMGPGMMMGSGMTMCPGMMGWGGYNLQAKSITLEQAADSVRRYLNAYGRDLELVEVMEFAWNFYAEVEEKETGIHAMELLVNKYTGQVYPEMGPNMMWNTKYGMMGRYYTGLTPTAKMPVTPKQAKTLAQQFLDAYLPGVTVADADTFYGYYTLHTLKDKKIEGMLSVNGYTGEVWYHNWHGAFIKMKKFD